MELKLDNDRILSIKQINYLFSNKELINFMKHFVKRTEPDGVLVFTSYNSLAKEFGYKTKSGVWKVVNKLVKHNVLTLTNEKLYGFYILRYGVDYELKTYIK